jgi:hypothetical protein
MDRKKIAADLQKANSHVRQGASHLSKQKRIVADLASDGHDTKLARSLLHTFEDMQDAHVADRDRLADELVQTETENRTMSDDKTKTGKPDRDRINPDEAYEVRDWSKRLGVSEGELKAAVRKAGPMAKDVAKALGKSL